MADISIDKFKAMLPIIKHRLDDELEIQPDIMGRIATQVVIHNSRMLEAKEELSRVEARLLEDLKYEESKVTKDHAEAKIRRHPDRIRAWEKYQQARADHEDWSFLLDAWKAKGFAISTLANLYHAQYYALDSHHVDQKTRDRIARSDAGRAALRMDHEGRTTTAGRERIRDATESASPTPKRRPLT